jgi:hypothetical protein
MSSIGRLCATASRESGSRPAHAVNAETPDTTFPKEHLRRSPRAALDLADSDRGRGMTTDYQLLRGERASNGAPRVGNQAHYLVAVRERSKDALAHVIWEAAPSGGKKQPVRSRPVRNASKRLQALLVGTKVR